MALSMSHTIIPLCSLDNNIRKNFITVVQSNSQVILGLAPIDKDIFGLALLLLV